jgi:hypothetical protein
MSDSAGKQITSEQAAPVNTPSVSAEMGPALAGPQADMLALQGDAGNGAVAAALNGGNGRSLDSQTRAFMESRFGRSFNQVRVHTGETAVRASSALQADAFAYGQNIWFNRGLYNPGTDAGRYLLAHELAHTLQQRGGALTPQTSPSVGALHHAAESNAEQAAAAVMSNGRLPALSRSRPIIRRRETQTQPKVTPVQGQANQYIVELKEGGQDKKYRVTRKITLGETKTVPKNPLSATGGIDFNNVWLEIEWCKGDNKGKVKIGANLPKQLQNVLKNTGEAILKGENVNVDALLKGVDITPFVSVSVTQSGSFQIDAKSEVTVDPTTGEVTRGGGSAEVKVPGATIKGSVTGGKVPGTNQQDVRGMLEIIIPLPGQGSVPKVECPTKRIQVGPVVTYVCEEEMPAFPVTISLPITRTKSVYLYYHYAEPELETDADMPGKKLNDENLPELVSLLRDEWQVSRIVGYASPEGPMEQQRPGGFMGNIELSKKRAQVAKELIEEKCKPSLLDMRQRPSCFTSNFTMEGGNELYSPEKDQSGKNKDAESAVTGFLSKDNQASEARHRTPELEKQLEAQSGSPQKQAELVYPLLRRAEITLTRTKEETTQIMMDPSWRPLDSCPSEVERAVEDFVKKAPK